MKFVDEYLRLILSTNTKVRVIKGRLHVIGAPDLKRAAVKELLLAGPQIIDRLNDLFGFPRAAPATSEPHVQPTDFDADPWIWREDELEMLEHEKATDAGGACSECAWVGRVDPGDRGYRAYRREQVERARRHATIEGLKQWTELPPGPREDDEFGACARSGTYGFLNRDGRVVDCEWCISNGEFV